MSRGSAGERGLRDLGAGRGLREAGGDWSGRARNSYLGDVATINA